MSKNAQKIGWIGTGRMVVSLRGIDTGLIAGRVD